MNGRAAVFSTFCVERQCLKSTGNETERDINITTDILISMSVMKV